MEENEKFKPTLREMLEDWTLSQWTQTSPALRLPAIPSGKRKIGRATLDEPDSPIYLLNLV